MTHRRRRAARVLLGTLLAALLAVPVLNLWPALPASAHASAVASWPAVGQTVNAAPDQVIIEFSTDVVPDGVLVAVVDAAGNPLADGDPVVQGQYVVQPLVESDAAGAWNASIHVLGSDLHPIIARVDFVVDPAGVATDNPAGDPPDLATDGQGDEDVTTKAADESDGGGSGLAVLGAGLGGVVLLIVVIRLAARRRTPA